MYNNHQDHLQVRKLRLNESWTILLQAMGLVLLYVHTSAVYIPLILTVFL